MAGQHFIVFYHYGDDEDAANVLAVLEQEGVPLFRRYLGTEPAGIPVYLATEAGEYERLSGKPGGMPAVSAGDTSVNNGSIFLYRPASCMRSCRQAIPLFLCGAWYACNPLVVTEPRTPDCRESCITPYRVIWAGAYASIQQYLGQDQVQDLPYFLREGMAKYVEYQYRSPCTGPDFQLSSFAPRTNGQPVLLTADLMERRCRWYTNDIQLATFCREETVYVLGYLDATYGPDTMASLVPEVKRTHDWRAAVRNATGRDTNELWQEIIRRWRPSQGGGPVPVIP
jgi:hypothetical protein